jgi:hypothetical protein
MACSYVALAEHATDMVRLACTKCDRRGQYRKATLLDRRHVRKRWRTNVSPVVSLRRCSEHPHHDGTDGRQRRPHHHCCGAIACAGRPSAASGSRCTLIRKRSRSTSCRNF